MQILIDKINKTYFGIEWNAYKINITQAETQKNV